jgi:hypothetical protein
MRFRLPSRPLIATCVAATLALALAAGSSSGVGAVGPTVPPKGATPSATTTKPAASPSASPKSGSSKKTTSKKTTSKKTKSSKSSSKSTSKSVSTKGNFTMSANPSKQTIAAGESTTTQIDLKKGSGFSSVVTITASGVPNGVKLSFPPRIQNFAPVTVQVPASVDDGTYKITFKGTAGSLVHTTVFTLVIDGVLEGATGDTLPPVGPEGSTVVPPSTTPGSPTTVATSTTTTTTNAIVRPLNSTIPGQPTTIAAGPTTVAAGDFVVTPGLNRYILPVGGGQVVNLTTLAAGAAVPATFAFTGLPNGVTAVPSATNAQGVTAVAFAAAAGTPVSTAVVTATATVNGRAKTTTFEVVLTADMAVVVNPNLFTAAPGASATGSIWVGTASGFATPSALSISGLPAGVTAAVGSPTLVNGTTPLTLSISASVPAGSYPFTVIATAGAVVRNSTASLTVGAPGATVQTTIAGSGATNTGTNADLALVLTPAASTVSVGGTVKISATVTGTSLGSTGAVLSVGGLPQNANVSVVTNPTTATSTITIVVGSPVALGPYQVTVTATAGAFFRPVAFVLTVTA